MHRLGLAALALLAAAAGCGGGPSASVGVTPVGDTLEIRAKACGEGGLRRVDLVDPGAPASPLWSAHLAEGPARRRIPVVPEVAGYRVDDDRPEVLPERTLRLLTEGTDGERWGGPRFRPEGLTEGAIRVAGRDVDLVEWEAEPARCPTVGLAGAVAAGLATAAAAGGLWLVVRLLARAGRRDRGIRPDRP